MLFVATWDLGLPTTLGQILIAEIVIIAAATVQGSVGFGAGVVAAPILLLIHPIFVPGVIIGVGFPLTVMVALRERKHIDKRGATILVLARALGTLPAGYVVGLLASSAYDLIFAGCVLAMVALSAAGVRVRPTTGNLLATGVFSGFSVTVSSIGGPPLAMLYQNEPAARVRSTLAVVFAAGTFISLAVLAHFGKFTWDHLVVSVLLLPGVVSGYLLSNRLTPVINAARLKASVLVMSASAALVVLARLLL